VPANDAFGNAKLIAMPFSTATSNERATTQTGEPEEGACASTRGTLWYRVRLAHAATLLADTFGSGLDTVLAVFSGGPAIGSLRYVGCDDQTSIHNGAVPQSSVAWRAEPNTTYWIQLGGFGNAWGTFNLRVRTVSPPANDDRGSARRIPSVDGGPFAASVSTRNATWQSPESVRPSCTALPRSKATDPLQSVWYRYTAESADGLEFDATGDRGVYPVVAVYTGKSFGTRHLTACGHVGGDFASTKVTFTPTNGVTYWIQVAGERGGSGPISVSLDFAPGP
jgi:hypothetical protein